MTLTWSELFPSVWSWEFLGFITGILSVLLLIPTPTNWPRLQWTNWIFSIISAAVYLYLFKEWTLYGNSILQIPFLILSFLGAWKWRGQLHGIVENIPEIPTTFCDLTTFVKPIIVATLAFGPVYILLDVLDDASPLWDGLILVLSLAALSLQLKKHVQSWYLWIVVDLIAVPFHYSQNRDATAVLYAVYMAMCFFGWYTWRKEARRDYIQNLGLGRLGERREWEHSLE